MDEWLTFVLSMFLLLLDLAFGLLFRELLGVLLLELGAFCGGRGFLCSVLARHVSGDGFISAARIFLNLPS